MGFVIALKRSASETTGVRDSLRFIIVVTAFVFSLVPNSVLAATGSQTITVDGRLFTSLTSDTALVDSSVVMDIKIYNPALSCILYEEKQTIDTSQTDGRFTINVGSVVGASKRVTGEPGNPMVAIFQNANPIAGSCGAYTPAAGDVRYIRISVAPSTTGTIEVLSPDTIIDQVPNALVAESLQGLSSTNFVQTDTTSLTQSNVSNIFSSTNYPLLTALLGGTSSSYVTSSTNGAKIPTVIGVPSTLAQGQIWFNSSANAFQYYNGSAVQTLGISGSGISALTVGSSLTASGTAGGTLTTSGTIDLVNSGVSAGTYPKVTVNSKGLVTYGTGLAESDIPTLVTPGHVLGDAVTSGTIGGSTAFYSSGNVTTSGTVQGTYVTSTYDMTRKLSIYGTGGSFSVSLMAPTMTADYKVILPAAQGAAGTTLVNDGSGNLSWVTGTSGSVTSVGLALPSIFSVTNPVVTSTGNLTAALTNQNANLIFAGPASGGAAAPSFRVLAVADLPAGYDASLQKNALGAGQIWIGNSSGVATAVTPYGDVNLSIAGSATVTQLRGAPLSLTAPALAGQVLRWDGAAWTPNFVAMTDLRSKVTGTSFFANSCLASQTLTFNSVTDAMACSNIAIANSQVSWGSTGANLVFAGPATGGVASPTFRTLTSADLPPGTASQWTTVSSTINYLTGFVGIGTAIPQGQLDVYGTGAASAMLIPRDSTGARPAGVNGMVRYNTTSNAVETYANGSWTTLATAASGASQWTTTGANIYYGSGNVGIGTNIPTAPLEVIGAGGAVTFGAGQTNPGSILIGNVNPLYGMTVGNGGKSASSNIGWNFNMIGVNTYYDYPTDTLKRFTTSGGFTDAQAITFTSDHGRSNGNRISFWGSNAGDPTEQMSIASSGFVGIGTVAPTATLDIYNPSTSGSAAAAFRTNPNGVGSNFSNSFVMDNRYGAGNFKNEISLRSANSAKFSIGNDLYGNGAQNFYVYDNANTAPRIFLNATGNVGFGTVSPVAIIDAAGFGPNSAIVVPRDTSANRPTGVNGMIRYNTDLAQLETYTSGAWNGVATSGTGGGASQWTTTGANIYYGNGNVGIGTTAPTALMTVYSSAAGGTNLAITNATTGGREFRLLSTGTANAVGAGSLAVYDQAAGAYRLTVSSTGNVGIGTGIPSSLLQVGQLGSVSWQASSLGPAYYNGNPYNTSYLGLNVAGGSNAYTTGSDSGNNGAAMIFGNIFGALHFSTIPSTGAGIQSLAGSDVQSDIRMTVAPSGRVGIGTTAPGALLDLYGTGASSAMIVPRDSTGARPAGVNGMLRYNTSLNQLETYGSGVWNGLVTTIGGSGSYLPLAGGTLTGIVSHPLGTAAAPSINFGDAASGLYSAGTGNLSFATTGLARMTITASGNVGIGTTNPLSNSAYNWLTVGGSTTNGIISLLQTGNEALRLQTNGSSNSISSVNGQPLVFYSSGAEAMRVGSSGTIGINSANPNYTLDVYTTNPLASTGSRNTFTPALTADSATPYYSQFSLANANSGFNFPTNLYGALDRAQTSAGQSGTVNALIGVEGDSYLLSGTTGAVATAYGLVGAVNNQSGTTLTNAKAANLTVVNSGSGNITNAYGLLIAPPSNSGGGTISTYTGLYIGNSTAATTNYGLYSLASTNYVGGNLGIGTASPAATLDVYGLGAASAMLVPRDSTGARPAGVNGMIRYNTSINQLETYASGAWNGVATTAAGGGSSQWTSSGINIYYGSGNVGIGTMTPAYPLQVVAPTGGGTMAVGSIDGSAAGGILNFTSLYSGLANAQKIASQIQGDPDSGSGGRLKFYTTAPGGTLVERVRVDAYGNFAIGTTAPLALFDVSGSGTNSAMIVPRATIAQRPTGVNGMIRYQIDSNALETFSGGAWATIATSASGASQWTTNNANIYYSSTGNVGIGSTSPQATLDIAGTLRSNSINSGFNSNIGMLNVSQYNSSINYNGSNVFDVVGNPGSGNYVMQVTTGPPAQNGYAVRYKNSLGTISTLDNSGNMYVAGNVGIGITSPGVALDVSGAIRSGSSTTVTACGAGQANGEGSQRYNYSTHAMEFCNGTSWLALGSNAGSSIGVGQTWQDLTASRSLTTSYQNSTGKPIEVNVSTTNNSSALSQINLQVSVDNATWINVGIVDTYNFANNRELSAIIPNAVYYRVIVSSGSNTTPISVWSELR